MWLLNVKNGYSLSKCKGGLLNHEYLREFHNLPFLTSVIIPTFNDPKRLSLLIKSLGKTRQSIILK